MDHFSHLPAELQVKIFDHLETVDAKAARAVSRTFRDNATPALFRSIVVGARHNALGAYQKVTQHPIYSRYVKEIIFDGTIYNQKIARDVFCYSEAEREPENGLWPNFASLFPWEFTDLPDAPTQLRYESF